MFFSDTMPNQGELFCALKRRARCPAKATDDTDAGAGLVWWTVTSFNNRNTADFWKVQKNGCFKALKPSTRTRSPINLNGVPAKSEGPRRRP